MASDPLQISAGGKSVEFGESTEISIPSRSNRRASKKLQKRRSSFFDNLSRSFRRSGGERGADVETLRGTNGPDFEGNAVINRPNNGAVGCGCFGGGSDGKERLLLIKGPFVFVFNDENDMAPKYAISLAHLKAKFRGGSNTIVVLEASLGDVEYEVVFEKDNIAKEFLDAAKKQAAVGEAEQVRKRLGHEHLLNKRKSVMYAEKVATKKIEAQPEKPVAVATADIDGIAMTAM